VCEVFSKFPTDSGRSQGGVQAPNGNSGARRAGELGGAEKKKKGDTIDREGQGIAALTSS